MNDVSDPHTSESLELANGAAPHSLVENQLGTEEVDKIISTIRSQVQKRRLLENPLPEEGADVYRFGECLNFGLNEKGLQYLGGGWHVAEPSFTWSNALHAAVTLLLPPSKGELMLEFTASGYVNPKISRQQVSIEMNGIACCRMPISEKFTYHALVPRSAIAASRQIAIQFTCPNRASPGDFKKGADPRTLGIALYSLLIRKLPDPSQAPTSQGSASDSAPG